SGELWKIWINDWSFKKKAFDGAGAIEYPDEMGFQPSIVMVDLQLEHATKASLPSPRFPGEQGWYFNQGEKAGISDEFFTVAALGGVVLLLVTAPARADVVPGDRISEANVEQVKELISPGLEWCVRHGFPLTVGESRRIEWPRAYRDATERYSGQVRLGADGVTLRDYVAGLPFPFLDAKDPQVAVKIMWNYDHNFFATDDLDARNFDADTGAIADHGPMTVERHFLIDHFRRLYWVGRLYVDPKPEKAPNPSGYELQQGL